MNSTKNVPMSRPSIIKYLRSSKKPRTEMILKLISQGADPNGSFVGNPEEMPPLFYIVKQLFWTKAKDEKRKAIENIFSVLIRNGMNVNRLYRNKSIFEYLDGYVECNSSVIRDTLNFLIPHGLNLNFQGRSYRGNILRTLLLAYEYIMSLDYIKYLIENGLDPTIVDADGRTVLHHCYYMIGDSRPNYVEIFTFLFQQGLNINAQDKKGRTALHYCLESYNDTFTFNFLVKNGAKFCIRDNKGRRPIDCDPMCQTQEVQKLVYYIGHKMKLWLKTYTLGRLFQQKKCGIIVMTKIFVL